MVRASACARNVGIRTAVQEMASSLQLKIFWVSHVTFISSWYIHFLETYQYEESH